jgi:hypothetical protein
MGSDGVDERRGRAEHRWWVASSASALLVEAGKKPRAATPAPISGAKRQF